LGRAITTAKYSRSALAATLTEYFE
jgi:hypothetical protein